MKTLKIDFCDFWGSFDKTNNFFYNLISEYFDIEISDEPDYVFCSVFSRNYLRYNKAIRIFYTGECLIPDFNLFDYALGFDYIGFGDRYCRLPHYFLYDESLKKVMHREKISNLSEKEGFCSFVYSNDTADKMRKDLFDAISSYKTVKSGGRFLNNIGCQVRSKVDFERKFKFSIACENYSYPGYTTEKIIESFAAGTIPIYWGDPLIKNSFNADAFINVSDFDSLDSLVQYIREIDSDDERYMEMIRRPVFVDGDHLNKKHQELVSFLRNIFEQDKDKAFRRNMGSWGRLFEKGFRDKPESPFFSKVKKIMTSGILK